MSIELITEVWKHSPYSGANLLMHLALADYSSAEGYCWPSYASLAKKARVSRRQAIRIIDRLEADGFLKKTGRATDFGDQTSNIYIVSATPIFRGSDTHDTTLEGGSVTHDTTGSVTHDTTGGDIAVSPDPSSEPSSEPSSSRKRPTRERDERLDNPALIAYQDEARLHVPISWRDEVIQVVDDAEKWRAIVHEWIGRGWNKQNIQGLLEAYKAGGIVGKNGKSPPNPNRYSDTRPRYRGMIVTAEQRRRLMELQGQAHRPLTQEEMNEVLNEQDAVTQGI